MEPVLLAPRGLGRGGMSPHQNLRTVTIVGSVHAGKVKIKKDPLHLVHLQFWKPKRELKKMIRQEHYERRESK